MTQIEALEASIEQFLLLKNNADAEYQEYADSVILSLKKLKESMIKKSAKAKAGRVEDNK